MRSIITVRRFAVCHQNWPPIFEQRLTVPTRYSVAWLMFSRVSCNKVGKQIAQTRRLNETALQKKSAKPWHAGVPLCYVLKFEEVTQHRCFLLSLSRERAGSTAMDVPASGQMMCTVHACHYGIIWTAWLLDRCHYCFEPTILLLAMRLSGLVSLLLNLYAGAPCLYIPLVKLSTVFRLLYSAFVIMFMMLFACHCNQT